ncbi:SMR family transporter [Ancylobacter sp. SL191]|nr:SMR family transporter [Ancylobacter sp. SL191]WAC28042.1 SMR family transporter [Ancylobacter sp. SL191]
MGSLLTYGLLLVAIAAEVIATTALARSDGLTRLVPSLITIVFYCFAFWCLAIVLRTVPTGIAYAVWSGFGSVLITLIAWVYYGQKLDVPAMLGLSLIIAGVLVINLFSKTAAH